MASSLVSTWRLFRRLVVRGSRRLCVAFATCLRAETRGTYLNRNGR